MSRLCSSGGKSLTLKAFDPVLGQSLRMVRVADEGLGSRADRSWKTGRVGWEEYPSLVSGGRSAYAWARCWSRILLRSLRICEEFFVRSRQVFAVRKSTRCFLEALTTRRYSTLQWVPLATFEAVFHLRVKPPSFHLGARASRCWPPRRYATLETGNDERNSPGVSTKHTHQFCQSAHSRVARVEQNVVFLKIGSQMGCL